MLVVRGNCALVAFIAVLGMGSALAIHSESSSSSGSLSSPPGFSCYGYVHLDGSGKLVAPDAGTPQTWPQSATRNECHLSGPGGAFSESGSGGMSGSSMSMEMEQGKCVLFVLLPGMSDISALQYGESGLGSASGSSDMSIDINVAGSCFDPAADWAQANGITCDEDGLGFALDGSFAYMCCQGDSCNDQSLVLEANAAVGNFLSQDCESEMARECVDAYAENYGCLKTSILLPLPHQSMQDECAPFLRPLFGCLFQRCMVGCNYECSMPDDLWTPACRQYCETFEQQLPAAGCHISFIGDNMCNPLCLNAGALYDGGDCLKLPYTKVSISHMLIAHDHDNSGTLDMDEASQLPHLCGDIDSQMFKKFDVKGDDGLDVQELYLLVITMMPNKDNSCAQFLSMEERMAVMPMYESYSETPWEQVSWAYSVPLWMFADANQDAMVDQEEAMMAFGLDREEYEFMAGGAEEASFEHIDDVFAAALSALKGDFWDHWDYDMDMAMKVWVKFADYSRDGSVSEGEALYIGIGDSLFKQLDVNMDGGLTADELIELVRGIAVGPCNGYRVVDEIDVDIVGQLPLLLPSVCKIAVMPGWNYAREMEPDMMPICNASNFVERDGPPVLLRSSKHKKGLHKQSSELMGKRRAVFERKAPTVDKKSSKKHLHAKHNKPRANQHVERLATPIRHRRSISAAHKKLQVRARTAKKTAGETAPALHTKAVHPRRTFMERQLSEATHERKTSTRIVGGEDADPLEFPFLVAIGTGPMGPSVSSEGSGSASGSNSGEIPLGRRRLLSRTRTPEARTPEAHQTAGLSHAQAAYCTGTLIAPGWVLTAAHCVFGYESVVIQQDVVTIGIQEGVEQEGLGRGCMEQFNIEAVLVHPGYDENTLVNDVALLKLNGESSYPPVELYDGGDLMFTDCKRLEPIVVGWGLTDYWTDARPYVLQKTKQEPVAPWECAEFWYAVTGMDMVDAKTMMCMGGETSSCNGDSGGPLLAPHPDSKTGWVQIGITSWGETGCGGLMPSVYTRVSEVLQWILSVRALGEFPAKAMHLTLDSVNIPAGSRVEVWKGVAEAVEAGPPSHLLDTLDSKCDSGMTYSDEGEGGMLITIRTTTHFDPNGFLCASLGLCGGPPPPRDLLVSGDVECDLDCKKMLGVRASLESLGCGANFKPDEDEHELSKLKTACEDPEMGGIEGCVYKQAMDGTGMVCVEAEMCKLKDMTWEKVTQMARMGKALTGGLGMSAERTHHYDFRTYICIRDWDIEEQLACSVKPKEFACFKFDEIHREFHWFGLNSELRVLKPEAVMDAMMMERKMIAALPPLEEH